MESIISVVENKTLSEQTPSLEQNLRSLNPLSCFNQSEKTTLKGKKTIGLKINGQGHKIVQEIYQGLMSANNNSPMQVENSLRSFRGVNDKGRFIDARIKEMFPYDPHATNQEKHNIALQKRAVKKVLSSLLSKARYEQKSAKNASYQAKALEELAKNGRKPGASEVSRRVKELKAIETTNNIKTSETVETKSANQRANSLIERVRKRTAGLVEEMTLSPASALSRVRFWLEEEKERRRLAGENKTRAREEETAKKAAMEAHEEGKLLGRRKLLKLGLGVAAGAALAGVVSQIKPDAFIAIAQAAGLTPTPVANEKPPAPPAQTASEEKGPDEEAAKKEALEKEKAEKQEALAKEKAEEEKKLKEQKEIDDRKEQSLKAIGGQERLSRLKEIGKVFRKRLDDYMNLKVKVGSSEFVVEAGFVEYSDAYKDVKGALPAGGGRFTPEELQGEIDRRLREDPTTADRIKTREDAEKWVKTEQRLGTDCVGLVARIYQEAYKRLGLGDFYKRIGVESGNLGTTGFLNLAKQKKEGFSVVPDKAMNILNPGTIILFIDEKNPNEAVHAIVVVDVNMTDDGYLFAEIGENTDYTGGGEKGAHKLKIILEEPNAPLSKQKIQGAIYDFGELMDSDRPFAELLALERGIDLTKLSREEAVKNERLQNIPYGTRFYAKNYVIIGNSNVAVV